MINNYLDYVKSQRKAVLKRMYVYREQNRAGLEDWGKGFYAGLAQACLFESRHWRALQKDIEAINLKGHYLVSYDPSVGLDLRELS